MLDSSDFLLRTLLEDGEITQADVKRAREHALAASIDVSQALINLNVVTSRQLAIARARLCEYPYVDLANFDIDLQNARLLSRNIAERFVAFPLFCVEQTATVAMLDPLNLTAIDQLRQVLKMDVDPVLCDPEQLRSLIARAYTMIRADAPIAAETGGKSAADDLGLTTGDEPIVAAVNQLLAGAVESGASDIHINPDEHDLHVRYRIDGVLHPQQGPGKGAHAGLVQRLKVLAQLDLTQSRRPQDGKFRFQHAGSYVDVRLSLLPTIHGENAVMRLLRPASRIGTIAELGMPQDMREWFEQAVVRPHGMILVTGPTGSGKTTTLYTALAHINRADVNIMTIEDPVELRLPLVRQIQVNTEIGLTFASALRSILRQDPDVVLVGEIRDAETARIAAQAAMTGHLVLSTLHTNDSVGSIARLRDLDVPNFAISNALLLVIAQRLARKVCTGCATPDAHDPAVLAQFGLDSSARFTRGAGCPKCHSLGYRGRLGVYELLRATGRIRTMIDQNAPTSALEQAALSEGMRPLWRHALERALMGDTTVEELMRLRATIDHVESAPDVLERAAA
ncbi:MAG: type II/IV secretion system protein [Phycisphaeraceae bacterium]|nr:type II/IV secretion system protein [Phycisphaeraceae bacterium]